mmetsp:Transcript_59066/g.127794  ORF Transcript_59066/g.127794 Transcript_59066/m.127794 type:complete len:669 (+) Transcript_59066:42-2048(+)
MASMHSPVLQCPVGCTPFLQAPPVILSRNSSPMRTRATRLSLSSKSSTPTWTPPQTTLVAHAQGKMATDARVTVAPSAQAKVKVSAQANLAASVQAFSRLSPRPCMSLASFPASVRPGQGRLERSAGEQAEQRLARYLAGAPPLEVLGFLEHRAAQSARKVGAGGHGDILLISNGSSKGGGNQLAVKAVSLTSPGEDELRNEVRALKAIQGHPHIVQLVDVLVAMCKLPGARSRPPYLCIAMEYVAESEPLAFQIRRSGRPQPRLAVVVLQQLAHALQGLHTKGLVHRDVWSENVLLDRRWHAILVDLGSVERCSSRSSRPPRLNQAYASPEACQCRAPHPADDSWALGLMTIEMLTGRFVGDCMGRTDVPIHSMPAALAKLLAAATLSADTVLCKVLAGLLARRQEKRLNMKELLDLVGLPSSVVQAPSSTTPTTCPSPVAGALPLDFRIGTSLRSTLVPSPKNFRSPPPREPDVRSISPVRRPPIVVQGPGLVQNPLRDGRSLSPVRTRRTSAVMPGPQRSVHRSISPVRRLLSGPQQRPQQRPQQGLQHGPQQQPQQGPQQGSQQGSQQGPQQGRQGRLCWTPPHGHRSLSPARRLVTAPQSLQQPQQSQQPQKGSLQPCRTPPHGPPPAFQTITNTMGAAKVATVAKLFLVSEPLPFSVSRMRS